MKLLLAACVIVVALVFVELGHSSTSDERIIRAVWPNSVENQAIRVASCESTGGHGLYRWAHNPSGATGLFQIMPGDGRPPQRALYNPWVNARFAYHLWLSAHRSFWRDWQQSAGCWS